MRYREIKMRKNLFWKIMALIFLAWLFLWLWNSSIVIIKTGDSPSIKYNKLTGKVYKFTSSGWERIGISRR